MRLLLLIGLAACMADHVIAEETSSTALTLAEVRAFTLKNSPLIASIDGEFAAQLAEATESGLPANPELEAKINIPVDWEKSRGNTEFELGLGQTLRLSDFGTRSRTAALMKHAATSEQKLAVFKLLKEVDLAFARLWMLQQQRGFLQAAEHSAAARARGIAEGVSRGIYSSGDQNLFSGEGARIEAELLGVRGDIRAAEAKLVSLAGINSFASRTVAKPELTDRLNVETVIEKEKNSGFGQGQRAQLLSELAISQQQLAKKDAFPQFTPQLLVSRSDEGTTYVGAGLTMPLPFFNRNQSQIEQREAELRVARTRADYIERGGFREEVSAMVDAANLAIDEASLFEKKVLPAFRESLRFQEKQFAAGSASLTQIWQTQRELFQSQQRALELWTKAIGLHIELELLIGQEL